MAVPTIENVTLSTYTNTIKCDVKNLDWFNWVGCSLMKGTSGSDMWITIEDLAPAENILHFDNTYEFHYQTPEDRWAGFWIAIWSKQPGTEGAQELGRRFFTKAGADNGDNPLPTPIISEPVKLDWSSIGLILLIAVVGIGAIYFLKKKK
jgi:hypothetical protein